MHFGKLGKLAAKHDLRALRFRRYGAGLPQPPASCDYSAKVPEWGMLGNDQYGDCGFAMAVHQELGWADNETPSIPVPSAQSVVSEYLSYTNGQDSGVVLSDMLNFWRSSGINGRKIGAFATVAPQDHVEAMNAVYYFGSASLGVQLPVAWQGAGVWDCPGSPTGIYAPGSWGGHAIPIVAYNATGPIVVSWGGLIPMTWRAYDIYCDECYAVLALSWTDGTRPAPNGFDLASLSADLALVGQMDTPPIIVPPPGPPPVPPPAPINPPQSAYRDDLRKGFEQRIRQVPFGRWQRIEIEIMASDAQYADQICANVK